MIAFGDDWGSWFIELLATWPGGTWLELIYCHFPPWVSSQAVSLFWPGVASRQFQSSPTTLLIRS